jgi:hypothetical protein
MDTSKDEMREHKACLREGSYIVSLGLCRIKDSGEEEGNLNYIHYMRQVWLNTSILKLTSLRWQGMSYKQIIIRQQNA